MTLYKFNLLSENDQAQTVWSGEFLMSRLDRQHTVLLYKVHDCYVEVYYSDEECQIIKFNPFSSKERLRLYFRLQLN